MNTVISLMQQCKVIFAYHIRFLEGVVDIPSTPNEFFSREGREGRREKLMENWYFNLIWLLKRFSSTRT